MNKLASMISLARKAGKLALGFDAAKEALQKKKAGLVLCAKDLSPKTRKEIVLVCEKNQCAFSDVPFEMDEIWFMIGKRTGILAVCDENFAKQLMQLIDQATKEETIE